MDVSVIIVNWNTRDILRGCLKSIYEQTKGMGFEVIVIDNASSDSSAQMVKQEFPQVILIENSKNRGFAAASNQGIVVAQGRYILLLNSDTIICDNAIEKTVRYMDVHPEGAAVGCQIREDHDTVQMTCFRFPGLINLFLEVSGLATVFKYNRFFGRQRMLWWRRDSEREMEVISGMFMLVRKKAIEQVGMMDEDYFIFGEDVDWCYWFKRAGWSLLFWPGAKVIHLGGGSRSTKQAAVRMFVEHKKSILIFFKKHKGLLSYQLARVLFVFLLVRNLFTDAVSLLIKKMMFKKVEFEKEELSKNWAGLRFCLFGREPYNIKP